MARLGYPARSLYRMLLPPLLFSLLLQAAFGLLGQYCGHAGEARLVISSPQSGDHVFGPSVELSFALIISEVGGCGRNHPSGRVCFTQRVLSLPTNATVTCTVIERGGVGVDGATLNFAEVAHMLKAGGTASVQIGVILESDAGYGVLSADPVTAVLVGRQAWPEQGERFLTEERLSHEEGRQAMSRLPLVLVISTFEEDLSWLDWQPLPFVVYQKAPGRHVPGAHVLPNVGKEVTAYLSFIRQYYDCLPQRMVFLHGHRQAYHQEDILLLLHHLSSRALSSNASELVPDYCNFNSMIPSTSRGDMAPFLDSEYDRWLAKWLGERPPLLLDRCCGQFVVTRERVRGRPLAFYEEALTRVVQSRSSDDGEAARLYPWLFEYLWHVIMGEPAVNPGLEGDVALLATPGVHVFTNVRSPCVRRL